MNYALMIIDLQKAFCGENTRESMESACKHINAILPLFRDTNSPIIWIQQMDHEHGVLPGSKGFDFLDSLNPLPGDYRIHKDYKNSFNKTDCLQILAENKTDIVVITGFCAEHCVLSTYQGALDYDLLPVILKDAIASGIQKNKEFVEDLCNIISLPVLIKLLEEKKCFVKCFTNKT